MTKALVDPSIVPRSVKAIDVSAPYYDLGTFTRKVKTDCPVAQEWFRRSLVQSYGFCHLEAARCAEQALLADPSCAMAYWILAYDLGPNYNKPWELFDPEELKSCLTRGRAACLKGAEVATDPLEKALCLALSARFPEVDDGDFKRWTNAYADEMKKVYDEYGDDLDVAALYADSKMNIAAWQLWDLRTGEPNPEAKTAETKVVLEKALAKPEAEHHIGVIHLYIHLMEMSTTPEAALPAADRLRGLIPDSGHLNHMPSHLDVLIGDYRRCIASNAEGIIGDEKYVVNNGNGDYYAFYRLHNYHFLIYACLFNGQYKIAMDAVERMEVHLPDSLLRVESPPLIDWLEPFKTVRLHILVRFGKWDEILALPFPEDREFYCTTTAMLHYARGIAYALTDDLEHAEEERTAFAEARKTIPKSRMEFPNTIQDVLGVGEAMLDGELEYRKGNIKKGFEHLQKAVDRSDNLIYAEPWGWMQPPRHAYAALKLEQGEVREAADVYAADLGFNDSLPRAHQHPGNVWALHGFHECLVRLGRTAEANIVRQQLTLALAIADVSIESSCFCRKVQPAHNETCCVPKTAL